MREEAEFWDEVIAQIEAEQVIPVVGPELLTISEDGRETPLYRLLAERLLAKYGMTARAVSAPGETVDSDSVVLRPYHELNDAVCALVAQRGRRVQDLYRPINDLYKALSATAALSASEALRSLASVAGFRLFVSVTPDDLLARAIDVERHGGLQKTEHIVFAPKLASGTLGDLPEVRSSGYTAVAYLFGRMSPSPFVFAIHDEDTLEFLHNLHLNGAEGMKRLFAELRQQSLLLIGCNFADWLSRLFIRLSNTQRLADARGKHEFLIEQPADGSMTVFFERFSPETWVFSCSARDFVTELARRWKEKHPASIAANAVPDAAMPVRPRGGDTIFISYSRDDLAAARRLFSDLQEIGADIAWFDKASLQPGDDFPQQIRNAIGDCYLFLPLVSATTESRTEGYFREEWTLASERVRRIQGRKFIVPIIVDVDYDGNASRYQLVPECFKSAHFGHAPAGGLSDELLIELRRLIRERRGQRAA
jgi:hypothetical protein